MMGHDVKSLNNTVLRNGLINDEVRCKRTQIKAGVPITQLCTLQSTYKLGSCNRQNTKRLMSTIYSTIPSKATLLDLWILLNSVFGVKRCNIKYFTYLTWSTYLVWPPRITGKIKRFCLNSDLLMGSTDAIIKAINLISSFRFAFFWD
jgi:hypothetical protein